MLHLCCHVDFLPVQQHVYGLHGDYSRGCPHLLWVSQSCESFSERLINRIHLTDKCGLPMTTEISILASQFRPGSPSSASRTALPQMTLPRPLSSGS